MNLINSKTALENSSKWFTRNFQTDTLPVIGCLPEFSKIIYEFKKRER